MAARGYGEPRPFPGERDPKRARADVPQPSAAAVSAVAAFLQSPSLDLQLVTNVPPAELTAGVLANAPLWRAVLAQKPAPDGPLQPRAIKSIVSLATRVMSAQVDTAQQAQFASTFRGTEFLGSALPQFVVGKDCGLHNAVVVCKMCGKLAKCLLNPESALRSVKRALLDLEEQTPPAKVAPLSDAIRVLVQDVAAAAAAASSAATPIAATAAAPQQQQQQQQQQTPSAVATAALIPSQPASLGQLFPRARDFAFPSAFHPRSLPVLRTEGAYDSVPHYLSVLSALLRADYLSDFVHSIHFKIFAPADALDKLSPIAREAINGAATLYRNIHVMGTVLVPGVAHTGHCLALSFWHPDHPKVNWKEVPLLRRGNLLCISTDRFRFECYWARVLDTDPGFLEAGLVCVELLMGSASELHRNLRRNYTAGQEEDTAMAECPLPFGPFAAAYDVLVRQLEAPQPHVPFQNVLVSGSPQAEGRSPLQRLCGPLFAAQQAKATEGLDVVQREAVAALVNGDPLVVVEGPTGTGKTHVLLRMAEMATHARAEPAGQQQLARLRVAVADTQAKLQTAQEARQRLPPGRQADEARDAVLTLQDTLARLSHQRDRLDDARDRLAVERMQAGAERMLAGPVIIISDSDDTLHRALVACSNALVRDGLEAQPQDVLLIGPRVSDGPRPYSDLAEVLAEPNPNPVGAEAEAAVQARLSAIRAIVEKYQFGRLTPEILHDYLQPSQRQAFGLITRQSIIDWLGADLSPDGESEFAENLLKRVQPLPDHQPCLYPNGLGRTQVSGVPTPPLFDGEAFSACQSQLPRVSSKTLAEALLPAPFGVGVTFNPVACTADNFVGLDTEKRWVVAKELLTQAQAEIQQALQAELQRYELAVQAMQKRRADRTAEVLRQAQVIGLRSHAVLTHRDVLLSLGPSVVLVDDVHLMLEPQLVACLCSLNIAQLVLAGESRSWRPSVQVRAHREDKMNRLDASVLERLNKAGFPCHYLETQYRLDPVGAHLAYHWCGNATVAASVQHQPPAKSSPSHFFWTHDQPEDRLAEGGAVNPAEAQMVLQLIRGLIANGTPGSRLTILATTPAQAALLSTECAEWGLRCLTPPDAVGREFDVVILSLVFTKVIGPCLENAEYCLNAVTRARNGTFILGNALALDTPRLVHWQYLLYQLSHPPPALCRGLDSLIDDRPPVAEPEPMPVPVAESVQEPPPPYASVHRPHHPPRIATPRFAVPASLPPRRPVGPPLNAVPRHTYR